MGKIIERVFKTVAYPFAYGATLIAPKKMAELAIRLKGIADRLEESRG